jgi:polysaccharide biosynthesis transport protein
MNIIQFLRILWARRLVVIAAAVSCVIGAVIVGMSLPPRWEAHSRVLLDLIKPDPVTGQVLSAPRSYVDTQRELIKDYAVAGQVADDLKLLSDPTLIRQYQARSPSDTRDFRRWVSQLIVDHTDALLVAGSNILEITYEGATPEQARTIADALRTAYIEASRNFRIEQAAKNAEWYEGQAEKARAALDEAEKAKTKYERETGVILQDVGPDFETARLNALAGQTGMVAPIITPQTSSPARGELAQVDAQISEMSKVLGPNHPDLLAMRSRRVSLSQQVVQDEAAVRSSARAAASAASAGVGAMQSAMSAQRSRVMAQRDKLELGRQLQSDVLLRRDLYTKTSEKAAEFRHEAAAPVTGITLLGSAVTPQSPKFPNWPFIFAGSLILGLGFGVGVGLLMELFGRRVRGIDDLRDAVDAQVLAVVATAHPGRHNSPIRRWKSPFSNRKDSSKRQAVAA